MLISVFEGKSKERDRGEKRKFNMYGVGVTAGVHSEQLSRSTGHSLC